MRGPICCVILVSHCLACLPFLWKWRTGRIPGAVDFACLSFLVYYDFGLALEAVGVPYDNPFFGSFFEADTGVLAGAMLLLVLAPWVLRLGARVVSPGGGECSHPRRVVTRIRPCRRLAFYTVAGLLSALLAAWGGLQLLSGDSIWVTRARTGEQWGTGIIMLYFPMHFLAFYLRQADSRTKGGWFFAALLTAATVLATLPVGQRTNVLLPFLMIALFTVNVGLTRLLAAFGGLLLVSALILPAFKWQATTLDRTDAMASVVSNDFARGGVLRSSLEMSETGGTTVCPTPGKGYVYGLLFFLPRQAVPFKGYSTATYFTARIMTMDPDTVNWGFGLGMLEEASLNFGTAFLLPSIFIYGIFLGLLDRAVARFPALLIPVSLAALWSCGYHLPALEISFGVMGIICWSMHKVFADRLSPMPAVRCPLRPLSGNQRVSPQHGPQLRRGSMT